MSKIEELALAWRRKTKLYWAAIDAKRNWDETYTLALDRDRARVALVEALDEVLDKEQPQ